MKIILIIYSFGKVKILPLKVIKYYNEYTKFNLINFPINKANELINKEKKDLLNFFSQGTFSKLLKIKTIFLDSPFRFGNQFMLFNKVIFYCEILGCKRIILNKKYFWYIKNIIYNNKYKMIIKSNPLNIKYHFAILDRTFIFFKYTNIFKPEFKVNFLIKEIIENLPKLKINITKNDLLIYIRSGDLFNSFKKSIIYYSQPPYCFYKKILLNFNFKRIYLISEDKTNPIINLLLNNFPKIIYNRNNIKLDMIFILKAYNIAITKSTFLISLIQLNYKIEKIYKFAFNFNDRFEKELNLYNYHKKNYIIYKMDSSKNYKLVMKIWKNAKYQLNFMIKEICPYNFTIIK